MIVVSSWPCSFGRLRDRFQHEVGDYSASLQSYINLMLSNGAKSLVLIYVCHTFSSIGITLGAVEIVSGKVITPNEIVDPFDVRVSLR